MTDYNHLTPKNTPIVRVEWLDIAAAENYNDNEQAQTVEVSTIGWLLADTPKEVIVAGSYVWPEERWSDQHAFPKAEPEIRVILDQAPAVERKLKEIGGQDETPI